MASKIKDPFQQGYAEGVEEGIAEQPRKTAIKILDALMETSNTMRRRGKQVDGYKKGISDAKDATQAQDKKKVKKASGGLLKAAPNKGVTKLPQDVRNDMGFMKKGGKVKGYKDGGKVKKMKKCRMDGIALRGKTRAKQRSK